jgi:hypothetical protein
MISTCQGKKPLLPALDGRVFRSAGLDLTDKATICRFATRYRLGQRVLREDLRSLAKSHAAESPRSRAGTREGRGMRKFAGQSPNPNDEAGGKAGFTRPEAEPPRPGNRDQANRLRHLLTIWRGVSSLAAMR